MSIVLFDTTNRKKLYPFTYNHAIADIRMGLCSFTERWQRISGEDVYVSTAEYLQQLYKQIPEGEHIWIESSVIADGSLSERILNLKSGEGIEDEEGMVAYKGIQNSKVKIQKIAGVRRLNFPWEIFQLNDGMIRSDFELVTKGRTSGKISSSNKIIGGGQIFIEEGAEVEYAFLNCSAGPIYIGKNAIVMENVSIRGPFAMLNDSVLKMGAKIYAATTLGPHCMGGGEIKNAVMQGYSNKAHDGYLGDSVMGEWCNLGAGTNNSNVKNTAGIVKMWNPDLEMPTDVSQKCGMIMGDYSRTAINTSINTGTFIGVCCNLFGEGFPPKAVKNFTWGSKELSKYEFEKAVTDIANWKKMKGKELSEQEVSVLKYIFDRE